MPPAVFVPIIEAGGLIDELTSLMLVQACAWSKRWQASGHALKVSVNVSAHNLVGPEVADRYEAILREHGLSPDQVVLVTDGLPTQGKSKPLRKYVDVAQRTRLFNEAVRDKPAGVPIDVILLPMQGDLPASHGFWMLARDSGGNFMMPSSDWP